jgi:HD superfamily phosphohydrolase
MYERICRNTTEAEDEGTKLCTILAALIHDVGHGPFSHTLEEILEEAGIPFHHEQMTLRYILDPESEINRILTHADNALPERLAAFFEKERRTEDHWSYKVVSSQLDADRLDYLQRDSLYAGIRGQGFDLERILDLLCHSQGKRIAVERGATESLEAYLMTLDLLYRSIYYHHTVRAATRMLLSMFRRGVALHRNGDATVFDQSRLIRLIQEGDRISLSNYSRLTEVDAWNLIYRWQEHPDPILRELASRIVQRRLFKAIDLGDMPFPALKELEERARDETRKLYSDFPGETPDYFVAYDEPDRTSYKIYDWRAESADDSIWLVEDSGEEHPLESDHESTIVQAFKNKRYFPRLIVPEPVRERLR